uniref:HIT domain-containing protein n=1 Tax=Nothobranchius furzeri TaxID=105023 RepID=A0A8C6KMT4_NOTFU
MSISIAGIEFWNELTEEIKDSSNVNQFKIKLKKEMLNKYKNEENAINLGRRNQELVCFRDIFPAAPYHFLVIPREHIVSCRSLNKKHISLVERMVELGRAVLLDQGITNMNDVRLGFHQFPFISVSHLHLHVLAPASQISQAMMFKFTPGSDSFITVSPAGCSCLLIHSTFHRSL